ncbi:hypothetical protein ACFLS9_10670, partial [Bacteroidota bacterium]
CPPKSDSIVTLGSNRTKILSSNNPSNFQSIPVYRVAITILPQAHLRIRPTPKNSPNDSYTAPYTF